MSRSTGVVCEAGALYYRWWVDRQAHVARRRQRRILAKWVV